MSDTDIKAIQGDLDVTAAVAAKDATIASQAAQIAHLEEQLVGAQDYIKNIEAQAASLAQQLAAANGQPDATPVPAGTPAEIKLTSPFGYIDDAGRNRHWNAGEVIATGSEIANLIARGASHDVTKAAPPASAG